MAKVITFYIPEGFNPLKRSIQTEVGKLLEFKADPMKKSA